MERGFKCWLRLPFTVAFSLKPAVEVKVDKYEDVTLVGFGVGVVVIVVVAVVKLGVLELFVMSSVEVVHAKDVDVDITVVVVVVIVEGSQVVAVVKIGVVELFVMSSVEVVHAKDVDVDITVVVVVVEGSQVMRRTMMPRRETRKRTRRTRSPIWIRLCFNQIISLSQKSSTVI